MAIEKLGKDPHHSNLVSSENNLFELVQNLEEAAIEIWLPPNNILQQGHQILAIKLELGNIQFLSASLQIPIELIKLSFSFKLPMKSQLLTKKGRPSGDHSEPQFPTYKNENVIFKIHTPKGEQNYNAKTFPAKFSINICNEPTELRTGLYNFDRKSVVTSHEEDNSPNKKSSRIRRQRTSKNSNEQYEKQIREIIEDKQKCDQLILQLQQMCRQYQYDNQELLYQSNQKDIHIEQLDKTLREKERDQTQLSQKLKQKQVEIRELQMKIKLLEIQAKKSKQLFNNAQNNYQQDLRKYQNRVDELESVVDQKQNAIKALSNFNNQISKQIINEQTLSSTAHVKQMERWLKNLHKKNDSPQGKVKREAQSRYEGVINQLNKKNETLQGQLDQYQKMNEALNFELKRIFKQNENLNRINEQSCKIISELQEQIQQKQQQKEFEQKRNSLGLGCHHDGGTYTYEGTVKIKMENLLYEKDKRISGLQQELMDVKKENSLLRTKIYQLDCEQDFIKANQHTNQNYFSLKKAKSLENFYLNREEKAFNPLNYSNPKENQQINQVINECSRLTKTLGSFMEAYRNSQCYSEENGLKSHNRYSIQNQADKNLQKMKQLLKMQNQTFSQLQKKMKFSSSVPNSRWNHYRSESRYEKENPTVVSQRTTQPLTERISKHDYPMKRSYKISNMLHYSG